MVKLERYELNFPLKNFLIHLPLRLWGNVRSQRSERKVVMSLHTGFTVEMRLKIRASCPLCQVSVGPQRIACCEASRKFLIVQRWRVMILMGFWQNIRRN